MTKTVKELINNNTNDNFRIRWLLKNNSKYDKLPSKDVK